MRRETYPSLMSAQVAQSRASAKLVSQGYRITPFCPEVIYAAAAESVTQAPDEPEGYLSLANVLEAHGDPRAELIRVQVALSEEGPQETLENRERVLFNAHQVRFLRPDWKTDLGGPRVTLGWRFGYIASLALSIPMVPHETVEFASLSFASQHLVPVEQWICGLVRSVSAHDSGRFLRWITLTGRSTYPPRSVVTRRFEFRIEDKATLFRVARSYR